MGRKSAENLTQAIEESKGKEFVNVLYALGIPNIGINASHLLIEDFGSLDRIIKAKVDELSGITGIGQVLATSIKDYFKIRVNMKLIRNLRKIGLRFSAEPKKRLKSPLAGKKFVFTGELQSMSRAEAQNLVRQQGAYPSSSVSKETDYVVVGKSPGSKYKKAQKIGISILSEAEFLKLVKSR
jgi:DNA ligase (NAD+)